MLFAEERPVDRGSFIIGGSFSYFIYPGYDPDISGFFAQPEFQYFIMRGLAVGADVYYEYYKRGAGRTTQFGIGPSAAYYMSLKDPRGYPFAKAAAIYHHARHKAFASESSWNDFKFKGSIGYAYFIGKNISIAGSLDYTFERYEFFNQELPGYWHEVFGLSFGLKAFIY